MSRLRRSDKEQDALKNKIPCFIREDIPAGDAAQPGHRKAVRVFRDIIEAETRTEHTAHSTVLGVEAEQVAPDLFTLKEPQRPQQEDEFQEDPAFSVVEPQSCFDYDQYGILVQMCKLEVVSRREIPE